MHNCPRCGKETDGSYSLGGVKWAICDDCMAKEIESMENFDKAIRIESNPKGKGKIYYY